jgi:hypothetical protein
LNGILDTNVYLFIDIPENLLLAKKKTISKRKDSHIPPFIHILFIHA